PWPWVRARAPRTVRPPRRTRASAAPRQRAERCRRRPWQDPASGRLSGSAAPWNFRTPPERRARACRSSSVVRFAWSKVPREEGNDAGELRNAGDGSNHSARTSYYTSMHNEFRIRVTRISTLALALSLPLSIHAQAAGETRAPSRRIVSATVRHGKP